jgi:hypothetical protein
MVALPNPVPVTCGCVTGTVAPVGIVIVAVTVTFDVSLEASVIRTGDGAGDDRVTANAVDWPSPTVVVGGTVIDTPWMVTAAVASGILGEELAWMVVEPIATPVTGTVVLLVLAAMITEAGTVATAALSELSAMVIAAGVTADKLSVAF